MSQVQNLQWPELKDDERGRGILNIFRKLTKHSDRRLQADKIAEGKAFESHEPTFVTAQDNPVFASGGISHEGIPQTSQKLISMPPPVAREPKKLYELALSLEDRSQAQAIMDFCKKENIKIDPLKVVGGQKKVLRVRDFIDKFREKCNATISGRKFLDKFNKFWEKTEPAAEIQSHARIINDGKKQKMFATSFYNTVKSKFLRKFESEMLSSGKPSREKCLTQVLGYWPANAFDRIRQTETEVAAMVDGATCSGAFPKTDKAFASEVEQLADNMWHNEKPLANDKDYIDTFLHDQTEQLEKTHLDLKLNKRKEDDILFSFAGKVNKYLIPEKNTPAWLTGPGVIAETEDGHPVHNFRDICETNGYPDETYMHLNEKDSWHNPIYDYFVALTDNVAKSYREEKDFEILWDGYHEFSGNKFSDYVIPENPRLRYPANANQTSIHVLHSEMYFHLNDKLATAMGDDARRFYDASISKFNLEACKRFGFDPNSEESFGEFNRRLETAKSLTDKDQTPEAKLLREFKMRYDNYFLANFIAPTIAISTEVRYDNNANNTNPFALVSKREFIGDDSLEKQFPNVTEISYLGNVPKSFEQFKEIMNEHVASQHPDIVVEKALDFTESDKKNLEFNMGM